MKIMMIEEDQKEEQAESEAGEEKKCPECGHVHTKPDGSCACGCTG